MNPTAFLKFVFLLVLVSGSVSAQTPVAPPPPLVVDDNEILRIESRLIMIPVSITDSNGLPVKGLTLKDFLVKEESRTQEIIEVTAADTTPLEIALLFDVSASTDPMFEFERETAAKFLQQVMRPEDRATIFTIGETPVLLQNRNVSFRSIETIQGIHPTKQYTAFYDTVSAAAKYLMLNSPPKSRKIVIAITDGEDTNSVGVNEGFSQVYASIEGKKDSISSVQLRELLVDKRNEVRLYEQNKTLKNLQNADVVFYSINPAGSSYKLNKISQFGQSNMDKFAVETGGTAFTPSFLPVDLKSNFESSANKADNIKMLEKIFLQLSNELQAQYLIQYYSDGEYPAEKFIPVNVAITGNSSGGIRIRARQGYFVKIED